VLDLEVLLTVALFVGTVVLSLQIADEVFSVIDARSVRDEDDPEKLTLTRTASNVPKSSPFSSVRAARSAEMCPVCATAWRALSILREQQNR